MAALTVVQSLVVGLGCLALAVCLPGGLPPLPRDGAFWLATFYLVGWRSGDLLLAIRSRRDRAAHHLCQGRTRHASGKDIERTEKCRRKSR
jgi:hypothetical protein